MITSSSSCCKHSTLLNAMNAMALALYYFCCIQLLLFMQLVSPGGAASPAPPSAGDAHYSSSSCTSSFMECSNFNITYPFWSSASCAASSNYVLSNCSNSSADQLYWNSFSSAASGVAGPPAITSISTSLTSDVADESTPSISIQLSWNESLSGLGYCAPPFPSKSLSQYNIPSSINLTSFSTSGSALAFSANTIFLLFNCTNNSSNVVAQLGLQSLESDNSSGCQSYKGLCAGLAKAPCIEWTLPTATKDLMLQHVLDSLSCSHFTFGITSVSDIGATEWSTGSIGLIWTDIQCDKCRNASGACISDVTFPTKFNHCTCLGNPFDFNTQTCDTNEAPEGSKSCGDGFTHCSTVVKLVIVVLLAKVVLGIGFVLDARYGGGRIRKGISMKSSNFIKQITHFAISVLKKTLRKLQTSTYGPNLSLHTLDFEGLTERPIEYSYSSIASATTCFSNLVGEGGFGKVYKGSLPQASNPGGLDSRINIAVKVLEVRSKHIKMQFLNEVITIGRIHHVNVVRLLGYCAQEDHEMLVYEFVENGSLDQWLFDKHGRDDQRQPILSWEQRFAIALGVARGLSYLHEECRHRTVHCDIKPQNILLDGEMCPKIADFGLARLMGRDESKVMTMAKGTPGYMAPEFWRGGASQLSTKFDVYSYGMVLLELISGQRNFQHNATTTVSSVPAMAFKAAMQGNLQSILDARLGITKYTSDADEAQKLQWNQIRTASFVALWCIQDQPASRPCMGDVVKYLEGGAAVSESPPQPTISMSSESPAQHDISISSASYILSETLSTHQEDGGSPIISVGR